MSTEFSIGGLDASRDGPARPTDAETPLVANNPPVAVGDIVLDVGCPLAKELRKNGYEGPAQRVRVKELFSWGLRICALDDPADEWDCEHWAAEGS